MPQTAAGQSKSLVERTLRTSVVDWRLCQSTCRRKGWI